MQEQIENEIRILLGEKNQQSLSSRKLQVIIIEQQFAILNIQGSNCHRVRQQCMHTPP